MLNELDLHVTNRCTTRCRYCCFSSNRKERPEMSTEEYRRVMREAAALGCRHVHFTGGEPLLREDITELLREASGLGFEMRLQTNGMLLTEEKAEELREAGLTSIMISLDSDRPEEHDAVRGAGTWEKAVTAVQAAQAAGLSVRVNSVLTQKNRDRIPETASFVRSLGVKNYSAFYFSPIGCGREARELWIPPLEYHDFWNKLQEQLRARPELGDMNLVIEKGYADWEEAARMDVSGFTGCGGGCLNTYQNRDYLIVLCDGNVYPCIMAIDGEGLGNVREKSLAQIREESPVWETMRTGGDPACEGCEHYALCGEGCRYYPQEESGHDSRCIRGQLVPLCPIMKYNTKNDCLGGSSDDVMEE